MSKEKPILFTAEMVKAIREGRKTVTRRVINPQPEVFDNAGYPDYVCLKHRYQVGDLLWVKEGWRCTGGGTERNIIYRADGDTPISFCGIDDGRKSILHVAEPYWAEWDRLVYKTDKSSDWRSSRFMPKWVARTWLEVVSVRPERVQDITEEDAKLEGIRGYSAHGGGTHFNPVMIYPAFPEKGGGFSTAKEAFECLWDSINAKRGYSWESNPFVWRIEFKELKHLTQGRDEEAKTT